VPTSLAGPGAAPGAAGAGAASPAAPVDLNTATAEQLDSLPGVGPATAEAILAHREAHGPFTSVEQLLDVRGIGEAKLESLRDLVVAR
jgi:competence protein ComEA